MLFFLVEPLFFVLSFQEEDVCNEERREFVRFRKDVSSTRTLLRI